MPGCVHIAEVGNPLPGGRAGEVPHPVSSEAGFTVDAVTMIENA